MAEVRYRCLNPDCGRYEQFLRPTEIIDLGAALYHDYERQGTLLDPAVGRDNVTRLPGTEAEPFPLPCGPVQQLDGPCRIRLRRTKGWRKPEGAVVVTRPGKWGNPFRVADCIEAGFADSEEQARVVCVHAFTDWLNGNRWADGSGPAADKRRDDYLAALPDLRGHDLACYCRLEYPCHATTLLEIANS